MGQTSRQSTRQIFSAGSCWNSTSGPVCAGAERCRRLLLAVGAKVRRDPRQLLGPCRVRQAAIGRELTGFSGSGTSSRGLRSRRSKKAFWSEPCVARSWRNGSAAPGPWRVLRIVLRDRMISEGNPWLVLVGLGQTGCRVASPRAGPIVRVSHGGSGCSKLPVHLLLLR